MNTIISLIKLVIVLPILAVIVLLCVANRQSVLVSLDPFTREGPVFAYQLPLFVLVLGGVLAGVLIGGTASWFAQGKHRKAKRALQRETSSLKAEAVRLRASAPSSQGSLQTAGLLSGPRAS